jgi:hypothetical protein
MWPLKVHRPFSLLMPRSWSWALLGSLPGPVWLLVGGGFAALLLYAVVARCRQLRRPGGSDGLLTGRSPLQAACGWWGVGRDGWLPTRFGRLSKLQRKGSAELDLQLDTLTSEGPSASSVGISSPNPAGLMYPTRAGSPMATARGGGTRWPAIGMAGQQQQQQHGGAADQGGSLAGSGRSRSLSWAALGPGGAQDTVGPGSSPAGVQREPSSYSILNRLGRSRTYSRRSLSLGGVEGE